MIECNASRLLRKQKSLEQENIGVVAQSATTPLFILNTEVNKNAKKMYWM